MKALALVAALGLAVPAAADSPLTSISFADAYADLPAVQAVQHDKRDDAITFLLSSAPNDQKLAVANALGWGQGNAVAFVARVDATRKGDQTPSDWFVAGYLAAMDDYLELKHGAWGLTPQQLIDRGATKLPDDFAVQYARALVRAQAAMEKSWCEVYKLPIAVLERFPPAKRNLRPAAVAAGQEYLTGYGDECPGTPAAQSKHKEELNQIYSLARLGRQVVVGAQGGIVVWEADGRAQPVAVRDGYICNTLTIGDAVWGGCQTEVVRWDGHAFKSYLSRPAKLSEDYYRPLRGPNAAVWIWLGMKLWAYDAATDRFTPVKAVPWKEAPYDALVRRSGEIWWVDFLHALVVSDGRTIPIASDVYPGHDPRRLTEDANGTLWVEDFESGLFRLGADGRFVKEPGLDAKASGIAVDAAHGETYLLHYTDGVIVKNRDGVHTVDLRELENMRDLLRDETTGDLWVAGWHGVARLERDASGHWQKQIFMTK